MIWRAVNKSSPSILPKPFNTVRWIANGGHKHERKITMPTKLIPQEIIQNKILLFRGTKVMLDSDLARLYGVPTFRLNEAIKRNRNRFPKDFMFQLTPREHRILISQFAISSWGGRRKLPYAFTEHGILMLSSVLNSERAVEVNIQIMRTFTKLRQLMLKHADLRKKIEEMPARQRFVAGRRNTIISFRSFSRPSKNCSNPRPKHPKARSGFMHNLVEPRHG